MLQSRITNLSISHGRWVDLQAGEFLGGMDPSGLIEDGFRRFSISDVGVVHLALEAAATSLASWGGNPTSISAVIFFTDEVRDLRPPATGSDLKGHELDRHDLVEGLQRLGIRDAYLQGAWLSGCSNAIVAALNAQWMVDSGLSERILVLGADRSPEGQTRFTGRADTPLDIRSDVGVAFLVEPTGAGMRIGARAVSGNLRLVSSYEKRAYSVYVAETMRSLKMLRRRFDELSEKLAEQFDIITCANYTRLVVGSYLAPCGLKLKKLHQPTKGELGHSVCADVLLNCHRLLDHTRTVLAISPSAFGWTLFEVEKCE